MLLWCSFIITLLFGWAVWHIKTIGPVINERISSVIVSTATLPSLVNETFHDLNGSKLLAPNLYPSVHGFKAERNYVDSNYILLPVYDKSVDQSVIKLVRLSDQKTIHQWKPDFDAIKKAIGDKKEYWQGSNKNSLPLIHPLLAPDGSIIFHSFIGFPLIKINKDSKLVWTIPGIFDHALEYDADGYIFVQSAIEHTRFLPNFLPNYLDDAIAKISPRGKVVFKKSIAEILVENGYRALLLGTGIYENDVLHVNDIQPALTSSKYWRKGDLLISIRHKSAVFLYRPATNKIIWLKVGPWVNQHDVDFVDSTHISVFGNNTIRNVSNQPLDGHNEIYVYDFKTDSTLTPYTECLKKARVSTPSEGRSDILPGGDLFIEETNNNRLLRINTKDIIWQYVVPVDKNHVSALTWTRFITKDEFKKVTFLHEK